MPTEDQSADVGFEDEDGQGTPPAPGQEATTSTPEGQPYTDLLSEAMYSEMGRAKAEPEEPVEEEEPAPDESEQDEEPEEESIPDAAAATSPTVPQTAEEWAPIIRANPARINEVSLKLRAEVLTQMRELEERTQLEAARLAYERGQQEALRRYQETDQRQQVKNQYAELSRLEQDDPEAFHEWAQTYPQNAAGYYNVKAAGGPDRFLGMQEEAQRAQVAEYQARLAKVHERLQKEPALRPMLEAKAALTPGIYEQSLAGMSRLEDDLVDALAELKAQKAIAAATPARRQAEQRQEAAANRERLPRPPSGGSPESRDPNEGKSAYELIAAGMADEIRQSGTRRAVPATQRG